jgi:hypothetical protein
MKTLKLDFINAKSYIIGLGETLTHWGTVVLKWIIHDNCVCMFGFFSFIKLIPYKFLKL